MKKFKHLIILIALVAFGQTAWAQEVHVSDETALRTAITEQYQGTTIILDANISITQGELVFNKGFILDLNDKTLTANYHIRVTGNWTLEIHDNSESGQGTIKGRYPQGDGCAFYIESGNTLEIYSGTIQGDVNSTHNGGVIYNAGTLIMHGGAITDGNANNGGAIYNIGTVTINNGTIGGIDETNPDNPISHGNTATNQGGAIYSTGTINLYGGSITGNSAANGGGIHLQGGSLTFTNGSISENSSTGNCGGLNITNGAHVTMSGGSIANNHSDANDGGVYLGGGTNTLTMSGGSITGNTAQQYAGIRINGGTMTMTGGSVTGNSATNNYGGIWMNGTLNMSGNPIVMGNLANGNSDNVYLPSGKTITVNGAFATGASVGVTCAGGNGTTFTSGLGTNSPDNQAVFSSDNTNLTVTIAGSGSSSEAKLVTYSPDPVGTSVTYLDVWENNKLPDGSYPTKTCSNFTKMSNVSTSNPVLSNGWYVVDKNLTFNKRITINGTVNIILMDNTMLTANKGVDVPTGKTLHIWAQSDIINQMGVLSATATAADDPGIGGTSGGDGDLRFHGGFIIAGGGKNAAGIHGSEDITEGIYGTVIYGGQIVAGGTNGAGIGGNFRQVCGNIKITGGDIYSISSTGAGIGSGYGGKMHHMGSGYSGGPSDNECTQIRITGGFVEAFGMQGAGIGGGLAIDTYDGDPADVVIEGGHVLAYTTSTYASNESIGGGQKAGACAIGWGEHGMEAFNYLHIYDNAKVLASTTIGSDTRVLQTAANSRSDNARFFKVMEILPCDHPNGTNYTDNGSNLHVCDYCYTTEPYTFQSAGNWNDASHWLGNFTPGNGNNVTVKAAATIPSGCIANVGNIDMQEGGSLTLEDGAQLIHSNAVRATAKKHIAAHSTEDGVNYGWVFIASPITTELAPTDVTNMTNNNFDLYRFNQSATKEWENYKAHNTTDFMELVNGHGYLYSNSSDVVLIFAGSLRPAAPYNITLDYDENAEFAGWNLVGNPFAAEAYVNRSYYKMNDNGSAIDPTEVSSSDPIAPFMGIMVKAENPDDEVTFSTTPPNNATNNGNLEIALSQTVLDRAGASTGSATLDKAIVSFNEGSELGKFYFGEQNANIYIPQGNKDYAIVVSEGQGEMPLNFRAHENGNYTISVNPEGVNLAYLHLIDNLTGADVDLLALRQAQGPASYTFTAKTTDYESRFRLVFSTVCEDADGDNETFAYINNGNIIVNGEGTLQIIDVMGRVIASCTDVARNVSTSGMTPGVYVLRLINGNDVKTQKIVVK
jgi:predicted outer membrane repeat protein